MSCYLEPASHLKDKVKESSIRLAKLCYMKESR